jgi:DNA repair exonuclease SbcCD ATPase subunit
MFSEINAKLVAIQGELRKRDKFEAQLADYDRELEPIKETIEQLQFQFYSEQEDVEKLERFGLTNLLATLSGKKEEKLSKEKQEMMVAQHRLEEAMKTNKEIDEAVRVIQANLKNLETVEAEYQQLLLQKEGLIKTSSSPYAGKVFHLSEREGALKANIKELEEAVKAGLSVEDALVDAVSSLEKAEGWGTWDLFGGGTIAGMVKHQKIDEAESYLHTAQSRMRQFQKELLDVQDTVLVDINISGMLKFADFFFDGFIADYMVQGKIRDSLEQAQGHLAKVTAILERLEAQMEEKKLELAGVLREKQGIVEGV